MRQLTFLRSRGSLTQVEAIGASFCKADGTRNRPSDRYIRRLHIFYVFEEDGVVILEPRFSSAITLNHIFRFFLYPLMGHPQAPLKMRNVRKSKVSKTQHLHRAWQDFMVTEPLQTSEWRKYPAHHIETMAYSAACKHTN